MKMKRLWRKCDYFSCFFSARWCSLHLIFVCFLKCYHFDLKKWKKFEQVFFNQNFRFSLCRRSVNDVGPPQSCWGNGYTPYFLLRFFNDLKRTCKWTPYHRLFCLILTTALRAAGSSLVSNNSKTHFVHKSHSEFRKPYTASAHPQISATFSGSQSTFLFITQFLR